MMSWTHQGDFYNYQKLETSSTFRLLQIKPSSDDANAPYDYSVIHTTFEQAPPYETLSYVWGTTDRNETVILQDHKLLRITEPLKEALPFLEKQCTTGYLWIDQICIDQDDLNERGHQVKLMGQIYSSCSRVLIWLGRMIKFDIQLSSLDALDLLQSPKDALVADKSKRRHIMQGLRKLTRSSRPFEGNFWMELLQLPWFQRAWVFQEIVLPPSALFILATRSTPPDQVLTISLPGLHKRVDRQARTLDGADVLLENIHIMYRRYSEQHENGHHHMPIEQTLSLLTPRAQTSEPLDRLYAFFGLNPNPAINLTPSYETSLELATVMINTAIAIIEGTGSLDIFEVVPRVVRNIGLPSWTPDLREDYLVNPFKRSTVDFRQLAKSRPRFSPVFINTHFTRIRGSEFLRGEEKRVIQVYGYELDGIVAEIGTLSSKTDIKTQLEALLDRCIRSWHKLKDARSSVWSIIGSEFFAEEPTMSRLHQALCAGGYCASENELLSSFWSDFTDTDDLSSKANIMIQTMRGRTLYIASSGRLVLGSYLIPRDPIYLVHGCSNPVALRPVRDNTSRVLGTCYLEGCIDLWRNPDEIARIENECDPILLYIA